MPLLQTQMATRLARVVRSRSFGSVSIFAGGNLVVAVLGAVTGLVQARWLAPETLGEFRKYGILTTYLALGSALVHDGLIRQYPYLLGKGDAAGALRVAGVAKWWYGFVSIVYAAFFAVLSGVALLRGDFRGAAGWGAQIAGAVALVYGAYLGVMYRTTSDFRRLSYNNVLCAMLGTLELTWVRLWAYWGLALRFAVMSATTVFVNRRYLPVKPRAVFDFKALRSLAGMSLRFSIPGYLHSAALTASLNALMLRYGGEHGLGIYGLAVMVQGMAMVFGNALNQMLHVKIITRYGATEDIYRCLRYALTPALLGMALSTVIAAGVAVCIEPFIRIVLPKYVEAVPVIQILSIALVLRAAGLPLLVIGAALWYKTFALKAVANFVITLGAVVLLPKTASMVAAATLAGMAAELIVGYTALVWHHGRTRHGRETPPAVAMGAADPTEEDEA